MNDSLFDLSGKVALVTGTSRGLGQYFAGALARAGADITLTSRSQDSLSGLAKRAPGARSENLLRGS
jgi:NAD(P)-dependent dehydrogenase (short-subunit alcohol dehydrogenase family)